MPLLEKALGDPSLQNGPLFLLVTELLISWEKKAGLRGDDEDEADDSSDIFQVLLADFWEGLGRLFVRYADNEDADPQALEGVATLLQVSFYFGRGGVFFMFTRTGLLNMAVGVVHVLFR